MKMEPCSSSSFLNIKDEYSESVIKISYIHENVKQEPEEQLPDLILPQLEEALPVKNSRNKIKSESQDENPNPPKHPKLSFEEFPGFETMVSF